MPSLGCQELRPDALSVALREYIFFLLFFNLFKIPKFSNENLYFLTLTNRQQLIAVVLLARLSQIIESLCISFQKKAAVVNTAFLYCYLTGCPYRVEGLEAKLASIGILRELLAVGSYQTNHIWILTMKTIAPKCQLLEANEVQVKGKRCLMMDPGKAEVRLELYWLPYHVPVGVVRTSLETYGNVQDVVRDTCCR